MNAKCLPCCFPNSRHLVNTNKCYHPVIEAKKKNGINFYFSCYLTSPMQLCQFYLLNISGSTSLLQSPWLLCNLCHYHNSYDVFQYLTVPFASRYFPLWSSFHSITKVIFQWAVWTLYWSLSNITTTLPLNEAKDIHNKLRFFMTWFIIFILSSTFLSTVHWQLV